MYLCFPQAFFSAVPLGQFSDQAPAYETGGTDNQDCHTLYPARSESIAQCQAPHQKTTLK